MWKSFSDLQRKVGGFTMDLWSAIKQRRSIAVVKPDMPPREWIEQMLEAATWAPNHHLTEPWRFFVLTGDARKRLGEAMAAITAAKLADPDTEESRKKIEKQRLNPLRAPVLIAVAVSPSDRANIEQLEEVESVACGVQNMLLTAHSLGLGAIWRTGKIIYEPELRSFFGLQEREKLLGIVYVGYPAVEKRPQPRAPFTEKTVWMEN
jgi:nitroreductase